jgi:hypothetical protein
MVQPMASIDPSGDISAHQIVGGVAKSSKLGWACATESVSAAKSPPKKRMSPPGFQRGLQTRCAGNPRASSD